MADAFQHADADLVRWEHAELPELVRHLVGEYHRYTRLELARLEALVEEALLFEPERNPRLPELRTHLEHLCADLRQHLAMEEQKLFPALLAMASGHAPEDAELALDPVRILEAEHLAAEELMQNIRLLTGDYTPPAEAKGVVRQLYQGLRDLEDNLHRHIHLENHVLFPRAFAAAGK